MANIKTFDIDKGKISLVNMGSIFLVLLGLGMNYQHQTDLQAQTMVVVEETLDHVKSHDKQFAIINDRHLLVGPTIVHVDEADEAWRQFSDHNHGAWTPKPTDIHRALYPASSFH